jgi:hypothetical protein
MFTGMPAGLGATLIVATLIMRRAVASRRAAVPALMPAAAPASWRGLAARSQDGMR